jgi:flavin-binding protein dodecin
MVTVWDPPIQHRLWEVIVSGTVARVTEISARSETSFEDAVNVGLDRANATLRSVKSAWIKEQSVDVENGVIVAYRVNLSSSPSSSSSGSLGSPGRE